MSEIIKKFVFDTFNVRIPETSACEAPKIKSAKPEKTKSVTWGDTKEVVVIAEKTTPTAVVSYAVIANGSTPHSSEEIPLPPPLMTVGHKGRLRTAPEASVERVTVIPGTDRSDSLWIKAIVVHEIDACKLYPGHMCYSKKSREFCINTSFGTFHGNIDNYAGFKSVICNHKPDHDIEQGKCRFAHNTYYSGAVEEYNMPDDIASRQIVGRQYVHGRLGEIEDAIQKKKEDYERAVPKNITYTDLYQAGRLTIHMMLWAAILAQKYGQNFMNSID
jgi:hypothetical protein